MDQLFVEAEDNCQRPTAHSGSDISDTDECPLKN